MTADHSVEAPRLAHPPSGPSNMRDLRIETREHHQGPWQPNWPEGTERMVLARDPETGGSLTLLRFPPGYDRLDEAEIQARGGAQRFEYHTCHEEIVSLEGEYLFGEPVLYDFGATSYLNHPPHWLHPARQRSRSGVLLLVRNSHPVDFGFCAIPHAWDGVEGYLDAPEVRPSASAGVTSVRLEDVDVRPLHELGVPLAGVRGERLWSDEVLGWETWVLEADPNVTLADSRAERVVGDEWFILEGELRGSGKDGLSLRRFGHWCDRDRYPAGGTELIAGPEGLRALRWVPASILRHA